ncbi:MAG: signal transduction histidine kinase [Glaciihabitans sp.]|nr:signal transduction histidine kinase [Glaciihabitans sp.]
MSGEPAPRGWTVRWSVRSRILASILLVAAIGLAGAGAATYLFQRARTLDTIDARLISRVEAARTVATQSKATTTSFALESVVKGVIPNENEGSLGIVDGRAAWAPAGNAENNLPLDADPAFVATVVRQTAAGRIWLGTAYLKQGTVRYIAAPITVAGSAQTGIYVDAVNVDGELSTLTTAVSTYAVVAAIALAAIGLVGWFVAGRLLRPIRQLRAAASRITASERNERIPVAGRDDVSDLTATVNDMLDRLDLAMTSQRQLLDDVRHELKTPITIVRGHLELLDASDLADVEATRALAIDELDRMSGLVDDIEALAGSQRANLRVRSTQVADLTADVFAKLSRVAGHDWALAGSAHAQLDLDPDRITQAWLQLADNAAKYSPAGSRIELGSRVIGTFVEFWVQDVGPGIPRESWGRVFERFGRVDTGRGIRGSGLGLPIVAAIAQSHGGRVSLESSDIGSRFGILVPLGVDAELEQEAVTEPIPIESASHLGEQ